MIPLFLRAILVTNHVPNCPVKMNPRPTPTHALRYAKPTMLGLKLYGGDDKIRDAVPFSTLNHTIVIEVSTSELGYA
jgi:hypothetical protein